MSFSYFWNLDDVPFNQRIKNCQLMPFVEYAKSPQHLEKCVYLKGFFFEHQYLKHTHHICFEIWLMVVEDCICVNNVEECDKWDSLGLHLLFLLSAELRYWTGNSNISYSCEKRLLEIFGSSDCIYEHRQEIVIELIRGREQVRQDDFVQRI